MMITVFQDVMPSSLVKIERRFRDMYFLHEQITHHPDDSGSTPFEMSFYFYETTRRSIPEGCHLHISYKKYIATKFI
jgi:hypothetical protein